MSLLIQIAAALLPAILLFLYIWRKDAKPEPIRLLLKAVLWGVLICIPCCFLEGIISTVIPSEPTTVVEAALNSFIGAGLPEELCKLLVLWWILRKNPFYDEHFDGIVYAVCVGLGFAGFENIFYVIDDEAWVETAISRALLAVPGHYAFAILMGYYYSVYHFVDHSPKVAACVLLVPILAHGAYDAIAMSGMINQYIGGLSFFVLIYFCVKMHKVAKNKVIALVEKDQNNHYRV